MGVLQLGIVGLSWRQLSHLERVKLCLARAAEAEALANEARANQKDAYRESAVQWRRLADELSRAAVR
jgi:hypothetical protein